MHWSGFYLHETTLQHDSGKYLSDVLEPAIAWEPVPVNVDELSIRAFQGPSSRRDRDLSRRTPGSHSASKKDIFRLDSSSTRFG